MRGGGNQPRGQAACRGRRGHDYLVLRPEPVLADRQALGQDAVVRQGGLEALVGGDLGFLVGRGGLPARQFVTGPFEAGIFGQKPTMRPTTRISRLAAAPLCLSLVPG